MYDLRVLLCRGTVCKKRPCAGQTRRPVAGTSTDVIVSEIVLYCYRPKGLNRVAKEAYVCCMHYVSRTTYSIRVLMYVILRPRVRGRECSAVSEKCGINALYSKLCDVFVFCGRLPHVSL
jgi:hypothetical protein